MKKLLLLSTFAFTGYFASAQCTPDPLYADSVFGVWPDTTENFMPGMVGVFYSDTLNLIVPANASQIPADPPLPPLTLDSIQLLSVDGLPPGITVSCNSQTPAACTYLPTQLGCGLIQGTPTVTGTFPIELNVRGWSTINIVVPFPVSQDIAFGGYEIVWTSGYWACPGCCFCWKYRRALTMRCGWRYAGSPLNLGVMVHKPALFTPLALRDWVEHVAMLGALGVLGCMAVLMGVADKQSLYWRLGLRVVLVLVWMLQQMGVSALVLPPAWVAVVGQHGVSLAQATLASVLFLCWTFLRDLGLPKPAQWVSGSWWV